MVVQDMFNYCKSESRATGISRTGFIDPVETLEDAGLLFPGNADACIPHADQGVVLVPSPRNGDASALQRVFDRIAHQVGHDLGQAVAVSPHVWQIFRRIDLDLVLDVPAV